jgi:hypothetical protein
MWDAARLQESEEEQQLHRAFTIISWADFTTHDSVKKASFTNFGN